MLDITPIFCLFRAVPSKTEIDLNNLNLNELTITEFIYKNNDNGNTYWTYRTDTHTGLQYGIMNFIYAAIKNGTLKSYIISGTTCQNVHGKHLILCNPDEFMNSITDIKKDEYGTRIYINNNNEEPMMYFTSLAIILLGSEIEYSFSMQSMTRAYNHILKDCATETRLKMKLLYDEVLSSAPFKTYRFARICVPTIRHGYDVK